jgi:hypothetical protein
MKLFLVIFVKGSPVYILSTLISKKSDKITAQRTTKLAI